MSNSREDEELIERVEDPENVEVAQELNENAFEDLRNETIQNIEDETRLAMESPDAQMSAATSLGLSKEEINDQANKLGTTEDLEANLSDLGNLRENTLREVGALNYEVSDANPEAPEANFEKEKVMEEAGKERAGIFRRVMTSEIVSGALDLTPFAGGLKMTGEGIWGKTLDGENMTGKERLIHTAVGVGSFALDFTGIGEAKDAAIVAGKGVILLEKLGATAAKRGFAKLGRIFEKTGAFAAKHPEMTARAERYVDEKLRGQINKIKEYGKNQGDMQEATA